MLYLIFFCSKNVILLTIYNNLSVKIYFLHSTWLSFKMFRVKTFLLFLWPEAVIQYFLKSPKMISKPGLKSSECIICVYLQNVNTSGNSNSQIHENRTEDMTSESSKTHSVACFLQRNEVQMAKMFFVFFCSWNSSIRSTLSSDWPSRSSNATSGWLKTSVQASQTGWSHTSLPGTRSTSFYISPNKISLSSSISSFVYQMLWFLSLALRFTTNWRTDGS